MTQLGRLVAWVLAGFYSLVPNYAVAIVLLGLVFMILVIPLTLKSTRSMLAMQKLQPEMKQLQQQFKNDRVALNQALTELYKKEGVSPFGSCLPTLIPLPLFYVLFNVIEGLGHKRASCSAPANCAEPWYVNHNTKMYHALVQSAPPGEGAQMHAFGINLATTPWDAVTQHLGAAQAFGSLLLLVIMIAANYYQQVQISNLNPMVRQNQQANPQMRMMRLFPIVFGLISIRFPSALILYYAVSSLFRVGQQWMMYRFDPKVKALVAIDERELEVAEAELERSERKASKPAVPGGQQPKRPGGTAAKPALQAGPTHGDLALNGQAGSKQPNGARPPGERPPGERPPPRQGESRTAGARPAGRYQSAGGSQRSRSRRRRGR